MRTRDDLVDMRIVATNQLAALLEAHWPGAKAIFAGVESPISVAFLTRYPTPAAARHLGEKRMTAFMTKHGYWGHRTAAQLLDRLRPAPAGITGEMLSEALRDAVLALAAPLTAHNTAVRDLDRPVAAHLGEHPDGEIFTSLPWPGQINAAQMLAEWGDCRQACEHPGTVAALAGKDHPHATCILARAWIRVIRRCWTENISYDPSKHAAAAFAEQEAPQSVA